MSAVEQLQHSWRAAAAAAQLPDRQQLKWQLQVDRPAHHSWCSGRGWRCQVVVEWGWREKTHGLDPQQLFLLGLRLQPAAAVAGTTSRELLLPLMLPPRVATSGLLEGGLSGQCCCPVCLCCSLFCPAVVGDTPQLHAVEHANRARPCAGDVWAWWICRTSRESRSSIAHVWWCLWQIVQGGPIS